MTISDDELIRELVTGGLDERAAQALLLRVPGHGLPTGGGDHAVLAKASGADFDAEWVQDPIFGNGEFTGTLHVDGALTAAAALAHTGTTAGFYGTAPAAQHAAIANATDAGSAITQLNLALAALRSVGLIAT